MQNHLGYSRVIHVDEANFIPYNCTKTWVFANSHYKFQKELSHCEHLMVSRTEYMFLCCPENKEYKFEDKTGDSISKF